MNYPINIILKVLMFLALSAITNLAHGKADWTFCYNKQQNRIYFQDAADIQQNKGRCLGRTYFQGAENFHLIEDEIDSKGFPRGLPGNSMNMTLKNGKRILVSHWNDLSKNNTVLVLEPNQKTRQVKKHCELKNFSSDFRARQNKTTKQFEVFVRKPISTYSSKYHKVWQPCPLN